MTVMEQETIPPSANTVYVAASPSPPLQRSGQQGRTLDQLERGEGPSSPRGAPPSPSQSRDGHQRGQSSTSSRRSRAHTLHLLGLHDVHGDGTGIRDEESGADEEILLTGLTPKANRLHAHDQDEAMAERQFAIGGTSDGDDDELDQLDHDVSGAGRGLDLQAYKSSRAIGRASRISLQRNSIGERDPFDDMEGDHVFFAGHDDDDEDQAEHGDETVGLARLPFEPITQRERIWMWSSAAIVMALSLVSIAIATDIIDWPGDGIGKS